MKWCRFHGILTPAKYFGGPTGKICGYETKPGIATSACTSPVYNLEVDDIDYITECGIIDVEATKKREKLRGGYHSCKRPCCEKRPGEYCVDDDCNCGAAGNHATLPKS